VCVGGGGGDFVEGILGVGELGGGGGGYHGPPATTMTSCKWAASLKSGHQSRSRLRSMRMLETSTYRILPLMRVANCMLPGGLQGTQLLFWTLRVK